MQAVRSDRANFREAHARALAAGDVGSALFFVRSLGRVMDMTGSPLTESYAMGLASLASAGGPDEHRAYALVRTASFAIQLGESDPAREMLSQADVLFEGSRRRARAGRRDRLASPGGVSSR